MLGFRAGRRPSRRLTGADRTRVYFSIRLGVCPGGLGALPFDLDKGAARLERFHKTKPLKETF